MLLLCGLPGSGKTTLSRQLARTMRTNGIPTEVLRFDAHEKKAYERTKTSKFEPESWKSAREACFRALRDVMDEDEEEEEERKRHRCVILDDTMHYKSMRREAYRYAREFRAAFVVVHVDVDEKECWERNSRREDGDVLKVPREAFERLKAAFDAPGKGGYDADEAFDKNYLVVKPPQKGSNVSSGNSDEKEIEYAAFCESLLDEIYARWLTDETPRRKDELDLLKLKRERSATDRVITAANIVHDVDVQTRKLTSEFMRELKSSSTSATTTTTTTSSSSSSSPPFSLLVQRVREARLRALNLCREETKFDARKDQIFKESGDLDDWKPDATVEKYVGMFREMLSDVRRSASS
jgi:tRNA uridine 5-carbamoylmethylation protein Kti12